MKIKKYTAKTMPEAMEKIRVDLGSNAVILNSKEITKGGILGLFKKRKIEVIAALDAQPTRPTNSKSGRAPQLKNNSYKRKPSVDNNLNSDVLTEIQHMKQLIKQQSDFTDHRFPLDYKPAFDYLLGQEIDKKLAEELVQQVVHSHEENNIKPTAESILHNLTSEIKTRLSSLPFVGINNSSKVVHLVGPTGVGKTTTIAKIAANSMLKDKKTVAFITTDTYRIGAIEQLKTYAKILEIPIEVAYTVSDYEQALNNLSDYDLILVDTAGRNFREKKYVTDLKKKIEINANIETFLVLSLTAKPKDIRETYEQFKNIKIDQVIFTKTDETTQYGSILNIALENKVGVAYLTNGQDVPDDLIQPTVQKISNYVLGGYYET